MTTIHVEARNVNDPVRHKEDSQNRTGSGRDAPCFTIAAGAGVVLVLNKLSFDTPTNPRVVSVAGSVAPTFGVVPSFSFSLQNLGKIFLFLSLPPIVAATVNRCNMSITVSAKPRGATVTHAMGSSLLSMMGSMYQEAGCGSEAGWSDCEAGIEPFSALNARMER